MRRGPAGLLPAGQSLLEAAHPIVKFNNLTGEQIDAGCNAFLGAINPSGQVEKENHIHKNAGKGYQNR